MQAISPTAPRATTPHTCPTPPLPPKKPESETPSASHGDRSNDHADARVLTRGARSRPDSESSGVGNRTDSRRALKAGWVPSVASMQTDTHASQCGPPGLSPAAPCLHQRLGRSTHERPHSSRDPSDVRESREAGGSGPGTRDRSRAHPHTEPTGAWAHRVAFCSARGPCPQHLSRRRTRLRHGTDEHTTPPASTGVPRSKGPRDSPPLGVRPVEAAQSAHRRSREEADQRLEDEADPPGRLFEEAGASGEAVRGGRLLRGEGPPRATSATKTGRVLGSAAAHTRPRGYES